MSNTLDSFVITAKDPPRPLAISQEIRDRGSTFVGYIYAASSLKEAEACISYLRNVVHGSRKASHEIAAFRYMALKPGTSGLNPDDFELKGMLIVLIPQFQIPMTVIYFLQLSIGMMARNGRLLGFLTRWLPTRF